MKKLLIIWIVFFWCITINAQTILDSTHVERIAKTCQLWGHLKYFHPYLADNSINWEKAFTDNIVGVIESKSKEEYKIAIQGMLLELNDPLTTVKEKYQKVNISDSIKYPIISFIEDSVLLVSVRDYSDLEDFNYCWSQFGTLKDKIPKASGVIFDLRSEFEPTDDIKGYMSYYFPLFESYISNQVLNLPGYKSRFHDGFTPEDGSTSGGYSSGFYVKDAKTIQPSSDHANSKAVFIVNRFSELPRVAIALQQTGHGYIISSDPISDASLVSTVDYLLEDSVQVKIRLNELALDYAVTADYLLTDEQEDSEIFEIATQFINERRKSNIDRSNKSKKDKNISTESNSHLTEDSFYPDLENRLLATAKIWTVIDYFFAYQDLMENDWNKVLKEFIPRIINASDSLEYHLAVAEMYRHIQDGHGFIRSQILSNYFGTASPPIKIRFVENQPVVVDILPDSLFSVKEISVGDVITKINGESVESVLERKIRYRSASNQAALLNYISWNMLNGSDSTTLSISYKNKKNKSESIDLPCYNSFSQSWRELGNGRNQEPITRLINKDIGYTDLDRLTPDMVDKMFDDFKNTKAIIFDMRGYPNGTAWSIAPHLTNQKTDFAANFRRYSPMSMKVGDYYSENLTIFNQPIPSSKEPYYTGLTVMLIDERTQSQAEHTGLFFESANQTKFIGSQTAGANGDVTNFKIPGNITLYFSGHDVRHIDGRQLQRIGLIPDVEIEPSINGIRNGKDEVLEKAIEYLKNRIGE